MRKIYILIPIILLMVSSCSIERKIRKAEKKIARLVKKYPSLIEKDTASVITTVRDTIITDSLRVDTTFDIKTDTVIIEKDKLIIRYIRTGNSVSLSGEVKSDTIYSIKEIEVKVPYETIVVREPTFWEKYKWPIWIIIILIILFALRTIIKKIVDKFFS